ncbi:hypothetical protein AVEN_249550-1 [Araneus ventricosus]|uniref:Uncharacterized protein n=1 Tax=Araneus ventricosus TaxID=182803 RepID=A0A4Y2KKN3_ARAVE|nr:hypothetical protein AVEN_249550-1 [Araneus ventricosus]
MESFRGEENHQFTKDAFLITLFDMRNQSANAVFPRYATKERMKEERILPECIRKRKGKKNCWIWMSRRLFSLFYSSNTSLRSTEAKRSSLRTHNAKKRRRP